MLGNQDRLLRWLCAVVTRRLKLPTQAIDEQWDDIFGAKDNCTAYFEEHLLGHGGPLFLVLDHVDRLFETPATAEEILTLLRAWHEMGKSQSPWDELRLVLGYSTDIYLPLHINHSPFNVGLPVVLGEWDGGIVHDLARRHGLSWSGAEVDRLMGLLGGHPHLIRLALYHIASGRSLDSVLATAATDEGLFADHLRYLLWHVQCMPALREAMARVMESTMPVRLDTEVAFKLVSLGIGHLQGNEVRPARELYRQYFTGRLGQA
jgi:serine/threonine-protein kinase